MLKINNKILCSNCLSDLTADSESCSICGFNSTSYTADAGVLPVGTILLGKYVIGKVLGRGGFGITYLGYDINNDKKIAIKEYLPDGLAYRTPNTTYVSTYQGEKEEHYKNGAEKFYDEAKTVSRFNGHPNIVNVYEFFYENNTAYFVMEYIDGIDFKKYIAQNGGKISSERAMGILQPIMDALMIVHSTGILHRDISPDNIYITNSGEAKLLDFGAARQVLGEESKSLSVILKQGFAPLEQYQKKGNQGPWSDIYALGATMYYAICGKIPEDVMSRIEQDGLERPSQMGLSINPQLENILLKMLAVKANDRFQSIIDLKAAVNQVMTNPDAPVILNKKDKKDETQTNSLQFKLFMFVPAAILVVVLLIVGVNALNSRNNHISTYSGAESNSSTTTPQTIQTPMTTVKPQKTFNVDAIETIINEYTDEENVAVSVNNFLTNEVYSSKYANSQFVAAGFYLPIYIQTKDYIRKNAINPNEIYCPDSSVFQGGTGTLKKENAMMGDYTLSTYLSELMKMDNLAANALIDYNGGFSSFNSAMDASGWQGTKFNRFFGDTEAVKRGYDNYTCAKDATIILKRLYDYGDSSLLTANANSYHVILPDTAKVNAHFGSIGNALNAYLIIQGNHASYSVAVLTKNTSTSGGTMISEILRNIDSQMEELNIN